MANMIRRYVIKGHSMEPAFRNGEKVLMHSFLYRVKKGDVVVFRNGDADYLKRVIRTLGEKLVVKGDNEGHTKTYTIGRSQVRGKFLMKY